MHNVCNDHYDHDNDDNDDFVRNFPILRFHQLRKQSDLVLIRSVQVFISIQMKMILRGRYEMLLTQFRPNRGRDVPQNIHKCFCGQEYDIQNFFCLKQKEANKTTFLSPLKHSPNLHLFKRGVTFGNKSPAFWAIDLNEHFVADIDRHRSGKGSQKNGNFS